MKCSPLPLLLLQFVRDRNVEPLQEETEQIIRSAERAVRDEERLDVLAVGIPKTMKFDFRTLSVSYE